MGRILFITGTDTGVGKTVLTGLLLCHLRRAGRSALALKPFCSGGTGDVDLLDALQDHALPRRRMNPFYFKEPVAPLVAARKLGRRIALREVLAGVRSAARCECLLVEGAGGLLAPLGEGFTACELIARLDCEAVVVARNQLGALNHTLLTARALRPVCPRGIKFVVMSPRREDLASASNAGLLAEWLAPDPVFILPFLGPHCRSPGALKKNAARLENILARLAQ